MIDYSLYLCTNSEINNEYKIEECVKKAIIGGVTFVQVREKNKTKNDFVLIAKRIKKVTDVYNIPLVVNDDIEVALEVNADGIHIGQNDISCKTARKVLGKDKIIGVSVTTLQEAKKAILEGADYLGVGAIYKSYTKKEAVVVDKKELLRIINFSKIPIVVIGGINENTIPYFKNLNISGYAMIRAILDNHDITGATLNLKKIIDNNKRKVNKNV